jgi:hypothetical protein
MHSRLAEGEFLTAKWSYVWTDASLAALQKHWTAMVISLGWEGVEWVTVFRDVLERLGGK